MPQQAWPKARGLAARPQVWLGGGIRGPVGLWASLTLALWLDCFRVWARWIRSFKEPKEGPPLGQIKQGLCKLDWAPVLGSWPADAANHSGRADLWTANVEFPFVQLGRQIKQFGFSLGDRHCDL